MMMKHYILPLRKIGEIRLILIALSFMMCAMIFCIFEAGACAERRKDFMIVPFCETIDTNMMCKYPMLELTNYFETSDLEYAGISSTLKSNPPINIEEVENKFPIEVLREIMDDDQKTYYALYGMQEGGAYIVFFDGQYPDLYASNAYCIKKLHAYSEFDDAKTFKDVQTIDAAVDFVRVMSRGTFSYSLLCNGELLEIEYMLNGLDDKDKENWAVVEKKVVNECIVNLSKIDKRDIELILSLE